MTRLVAVSNRVPSLTNAPSSGGLSVALRAALEERGGIWFGWSGLTAENPEPAATLHDMSGFTLATIDLTPDELRGYYEQHANRGLWPLLHGRLDLTTFEHAAYAVYRKVNRRFARALAPLIQAEDVLWIHDYHLVPLGMELRKLGVRTPIGFFLHTPFPSTDALAAFPWQRDLLEQLSAYDLVGFQTANGLRNFRDATATQSIGYVNADHYPIGIGTDAFAERAVSPAAQRWISRYTDFLDGRLWAVGVDRLDYTKGLAERFKAFETLFERTPDLAGRLSLLQIAAPSRETVAEYQMMQEELETLSGHINGRLGRFDWMPIRYINRAASHDQLAALFRVSRIGVVTPLRDGMNMVAKEYVAAQDPEDPGVLVLSRFAGAAEELTGALLVNPYDRVGTAQALRQAARMPLAERQRRWQPMMDHLRRYDVHDWWRNFLRDLTDRGRTHDTVGVAVG